MYMKNKNKSYIYIIVLVLIIIVGLLVYFNRKSLETYDSNPKIWAMSFGGGGQNFYDALNRISEELARTNIFDEIVKFTDIDLKKDSEFWEIHKDFIENNKRGYGYWLWKPYLISKTFEKMNDGDILIHLDAGCEIASPETASEKLLSFIEQCKKFDILYTSTGHDEKSFTKMDLFSHMNMMNDQIMDSIENQATLIILKKTRNTEKFVKDWYDLSCDYHLIDDSESVIPNHKTFNDHRHTQSTFSLLTKTDEYKDIVNTENNLLQDSYPILLSRKRNG